MVTVKLIFSKEMLFEMFQSSISKTILLVLVVFILTVIVSVILSFSISPTIATWFFGIFIILAAVVGFLGSATEIWSGIRTRDQEEKQTTKEYRILLEELEKEIYTLYQIMRKVKQPVNTLVWNQFKSQFDNETELLEIQVFYDNFHKYSKLERRRGTGHKIEAWVNSSNIETLYLAAQSRIEHLKEKSEE